MSAHAAPAPSGPTFTIHGRPYPVLLPKLSDPRLHLAAVIISLQIIGQVGFDFELSISQILLAIGTARRARSRDRDAPAARPPVAGERDPDRQRRRVRPPRARHRARRLVEPPRLVDLRRNLCRRAALEVRDQVARRAHLQPVEHRSRPLLPHPRPDPRGAARLLVGTDVGVARDRARDHRRRRVPDPLAAEAAAGGDRLLDHVRDRDRDPRARRAHDDRPVAPRPDLGLPPLVDPHHLARGARLPLLHDHRPEDGAALADGPARLRRLARRARRRDDRADHHRVRGQGRAARLTRRRVSRAAAAASRPDAARPAARPRDRSRSRSRGGGGDGGRQRARGRVCLASGAAGTPARDLDPARPGRPDEARPAHGAADRLRPPRREAVGRRRAAPGLARPGRGAGPADRNGAARRLGVPPAPDRGRAVGASLVRAGGPGRGRAEELRAGRDPVAERRAGGRPRLPPGLVPLRGLERLHGDDGRRRLLARLQRRRLGGPLRGQLVRERRYGAVGGARRAAAHAAVRERPRPLPQRHLAVARRAPGAGRRLRCRGSERRRPARPDRDDDERDQAALEQRQRHLHRGCQGRGDDRARLVHGRRRRGRERRRSPGHLRRRLRASVRVRCRTRSPASPPTSSASAISST